MCREFVREFPCPCGLRTVIMKVSLAHLFHMLKEAIKSGPEGAARACFRLSDGIRMAYENNASAPEGAQAL